MAAEPRDRRADEIVGASGPPWRIWIAVLATVGLLLGYLVAHRKTAAEPVATRTVPPAGAPARGSGSGPWIGLGPPGLRLLVGGPSPRLVDAATGASTGLDVPAAGAGAAAWLIPTGRGAVALVTPVGPGKPAGRRQAYLVRPGSTPVWLGAADGGIATRHGGVITVVRTPTGNVLCGFGADGTQLWRRRVAAGTEPRADTRYGLLVQVAAAAATGEFGALRLVDPVTGKLRREVSRQARALLASRADEVAWGAAGPCPPHCAVRVTDLATGVTRTVGAGFRRTPAAGAFSPDGRWLALTFEAGVPADSADRYPDGQVGVVDLDSGVASMLRGYSAGLYPPAWVDWSPDGHLVIMLASLLGRERLRVAVSRHTGWTDGFTILPWYFLATQSLTVAP